MNKFSRFLFITVISLISFFGTIIAQETSESYKVFFVTGELSGDRLGAWYLNQLKQEHSAVNCTAIGGSYLQKEGAQLTSKSSELELGAVSVRKFLARVPIMKAISKNIKNYINKDNFDEVVLIDCPLVNLKMAKYIKKKHPKIKVTYIAPPEMWLWGTWGIHKTLKKYCDDVLVIYPFEKDWYEQKGFKTTFKGYPFYQTFVPYFEFYKNKKNSIAFLIGSRKSEIETSIPIFAKLINSLHKQYPDLEFVIPVAHTFSIDVIKQKFNLDKIHFIQDDHEKNKALAQCCLAVTVPGTATLELALLKTPTIIAYKAPLLTYLLAKSIIKAKYVGLPNLLLKEEICKELIQKDFTEQKIFAEIQKIYNCFLEKDKQGSYQRLLDELEPIRTLLKS
jgi:lipid-A-disaccharide synthase